VYDGTVGSQAPSEARDASRRLESVLLAEDDAALRRALAQWVRERGLQVRETGTVEEARHLLAPPPDLLLVDVRLADASAFSLLEDVAGLWPRPIVVAMSGCASAEEAFRLARLGVCAYLEKPLSLARLAEAIESARRQADLEDAALLDSLASACVGQLSLREVQEDVRQAMIRQALALSEGSRAGAARLLDVTRQAVQQMLRLDPDAAARIPESRLRSLAPQARVGDAKDA